MQAATGPFESARILWSAPVITDDIQLQPENVEISIYPSPVYIVNLDPLDDAHGVELSIGTFTVIYSYTDVSSQTAECTFTVTVIGKMASWC